MNSHLGVLRYNEPNEFGVSVDEIMNVNQLGLTQDGIRHSPEIMRVMVEFVRNGGKFNYDHLKSFNPNKTNLIAITRYEDVLRVRDGFHRVLAIFLGRQGEMYDDEYFIEDLTYERMMTPNLAIGYFTPFDPRVEVRKSDFWQFNETVRSIIRDGGNPTSFIKNNKAVYAKPRQPYHENIETFAEKLTVDLYL